MENTEADVERGGEMDVTASLLEREGADKESTRLWCGNAARDKQWLKSFLHKQSLCVDPANCSLSALLIGPWF